MGSQVSRCALRMRQSVTYALGVWGGSRLFGRASETVFRRTSYGLVCLAVLIGLPLWG